MLLLGKNPTRELIDLYYSRPQSERGKNFWDYAAMTKGMGEYGNTKSQFNKEKWLPIARDMPFLVSHYCCMIMKKRPLHKFEKQIHSKPYLGTLAEESKMRKQAWLRHGCNAFEGRHISSQPLSFWTEQDILEYIKRNKLDICSVYGEIETLKNGNLHLTGCQRTGW